MALAIFDLDETLIHGDCLEYMAGLADGAGRGGVLALVN